MQTNDAKGYDYRAARHHGEVQGGAIYFKQSMLLLTMSSWEDPEAFGASHDRPDVALNSYVFTMIYSLTEHIIFYSSERNYNARTFALKEFAYNRGTVMPCHDATFP